MWRAAAGRGNENDLGRRGARRAQDWPRCLRTAAVREIHAEFAVEAADVDAHGVFGDAEAAADFAVGVAGGELGEHVALAGGEAGVDGRGTGVT
jgi:hypothetical protein